MELTEFEIALTEVKLHDFIESRRPAPDLRSKLDLGFRFENGVAEIFELRPDWQDASVTLEHPSARAIYQDQGNWKVYWMRADLDWHTYPHAPEVHSIDEFIRLVHEDAYCCFWG